MEKLWYITIGLVTVLGVTLLLAGAISIFARKHEKREGL